MPPYNKGLPPLPQQRCLTVFVMRGFWRGKFSGRGLTNYDPLIEDQFRVLILQPGKSQDPLRGTLEVRRLREEPFYFAISYSWKFEESDKYEERQAAGQDFRIHLQNGSLHIGKSLDGALRQFREESKVATLWADYVCINQKDEPEKSRQVALMADIYKTSQKTLIWLGPAQKTDKLAFCTIRVLHSVWRDLRLTQDIYGAIQHSLQDVVDLLGTRHANEHVSLGASSNDPSDAQQPSLACPTLPEALTALGPVCKRRWFKRLWVLQEVAVARRCSFFCGPYSVAYMKLMAALELCTGLAIDARTSYLVSGLPRRELSHAKSVGGMIETWRSRLYKDEILRFHAVLMFTAMVMDCTDSRDHVYALSSLKFINKNPSLAPNYALTPAKLWQRLTIAILTNHSCGHNVSSAFVLALSGVQSHKREASLPSWVPDFEACYNNRGIRHKYAFYNDEALEPSSWAGGHDMRLKVVPDARDSGTIHIRGIFLSRVARTFDSTQPRPKALGISEYVGASDRISIGEQKGAHQLLRWYFHCLSTAEKIEPKIAGWHKEFATFLMQGHLGNGQPLDQSWDVVLSQWLRSCGFSSRSSDSLNVMRTHLSPFMQNNRIHYNHDETRVLAEISGPYIAWLPRKATKDDFVCLFEGAPFPFVLRSSGKGYYSVVGDAYVYGVMDGKAWSRSRDNLTTFTLR